MGWQMIFASVVIACILGSLIPALVVKVLMLGIFTRNVRFIAVLLGMAASLLVTSLILMAMGYDSQEALDALPDDMAIGLGIATFILQVVLLNLIAWDRFGGLIGAWRWVVVLLAQYLVYAILGYVLVASMGG